MMEFTELQSMLRTFDEKVTENVRLNRELVKTLLTDKTEKWLHREKRSALLYVLSPLVLCLLVILSDFRFDFTIRFCAGFGLFIATYTFSYVRDVKYLLLLRKIDFAEPVIAMKKRIKEVEKAKLTMNRIRYTVMPVAIVGILLMIVPAASFTPEFIVMLILTGGVFIGSVYYSRYAVRERFKAINKEISELEALEK